MPFLPRAKGEAFWESVGDVENERGPSEGVVQPLFDVELRSLDLAETDVPVAQEVFAFWETHRYVSRAAATGLDEHDRDPGLAQPPDGSARDRGRRDAWC
jgi:hypothetical protein